MKKQDQVSEIIMKHLADPIYIQIKCLKCGHTQKTTKHKGKVICENCNKEIDIEQGYRFGRGDWG